MNTEPLIQKGSVEKGEVDDPQLEADQALVDMLNRGLPYCELAKTLQGVIIIVGFILFLMACVVKLLLLHGDD